MGTNRGSTTIVYATSVAVDDSGNVYIGGNFGTTITFGTISKTAVGSYDIFVVRFQE